MPIIAFLIFLLLALPIHNIIFFIYGLSKKRVELKHLSYYLIGTIALPVIIANVGPTTEFGRGVFMGITEFTVLATIFLVNLICAFFLSITCWWKLNDKPNSQNILDN